MASWPMPKAAVELVLRYAQSRSWAWSTIASNLSMVASALESIQMYSNATEPVNIRNDPYFKAVCEKAQKNARIAALRPFKSAALSHANYINIAERLKSRPAAWCLLHLSWHFASRLGDMRRISPRELTFDFSECSSTIPAIATFTEGKGAYFWGPYTLHTRIPYEQATSIQEYLRVRMQTGYPHAFSTGDQEHIATEIRRLPDHTVRSIRKGAINFLATCGVTNAHLQLLSGHRSEDTLKRYLEWGRNDHDAKAAARARNTLIEKYVSSAQRPEVSGGSEYVRHPRWMGMHSGYHGDKQGRRTKAQPKMFPFKAPSSTDLGIVTTQRNASTTFHAVKNLSAVNFTTLFDITHNEDLRNELQIAHRWTTSSEFYGTAEMPPIAKCQVPYSRFTAQQALTLLECEKMVPFSGTIRGAVKGFCAFQENKNRDRPVFEPLYNHLISKEKLPAVTYQPRLSNRAKLAKRKFFWEFDFRAWYDHLLLDPSVYDMHVLRLSTPIEWNGERHDTFALTRVAMGSSFSAHVAQTVTWALLEEVLGMPEVVVATMIDNVAIASDDEDKPPFLRRAM
eukprot:PhM_4_TR16809/c0_g1_i6/m.52213